MTILIGIIGAKSVHSTASRIQQSRHSHCHPSLAARFSPYAHSYIRYCVPTALTLDRYSVQLQGLTLTSPTRRQRQRSALVKRGIISNIVIKINAVHMVSYAHAAIWPRPYFSYFSILNTVTESRQTVVVLYYQAA